jgi:hypothetical protein
MCNSIPKTVGRSRERQRVDIFRISGATSNLTVHLIIPLVQIRCIFINDYGIVIFKDVVLAMWLPSSKFKIER